VTGDGHLDLGLSGVGGSADSHRLLGSGRVERPPPRADASPTRPYLKTPC